MKTSALLVFLFLFAGSTDNKIIPAVATHHPTEQTVKSDYVTRSCPEGYEGHLIVEKAGLDGMDLMFGINAFQYGFNDEYGPFLAACFPKAEIDELRKDKESEVWISPPRPE